MPFYTSLEDIFTYYTSQNLLRIYASGEVLKDRKFWADAEVVALRAGVKRHGVGKWVRILKDIDFGPHLQGTV